MNKKIVVSLIALAVFIGGIAFVVTRNNDGGADEAVASVQELPEIQTQEIDVVVEAESEVEEVEEIEEVKVEAESNGVSEDDEIEADEQESEESIVAVVKDEEDEIDEADEADKAETTPTQTTETASTTQSTASNQNVVDDTSADAWAAFGDALGVPVESATDNSLSHPTGAVWE